MNDYGVLYWVRFSIKIMDETLLCLFFHWFMLHVYTPLYGKWRRPDSTQKYAEVNCLNQWCIVLFWSWLQFSLLIRKMISAMAGFEFMKHNQTKMAFIQFCFDTATKVFQNSNNWYSTGKLRHNTLNEYGNTVIPRLTRIRLTRFRWVR